MTQTTKRRVAFGLLLATVAVVLIGIPQLIQHSDVRNEGEWSFRGFSFVVALIFAGTGTLLASRRPENPVGWLFCVTGLAFATFGLVDLVAVIPLIQGSTSDVVYLFAWLSSWAWTLFLAAIAFAVLLFPTGRLPSPRWRIPAFVMGAGFGLGALAFAVTPGPLNNVPSSIQNRYALPPGFLTDVLVNVGLTMFMAGLVLAVVGVIQRFRRSRGIERQQMKLFVFAAASMVASMVLVFASEFVIPGFGDIAEMISSLATMAIPLSMAVAILRYRLYDIDLVINRALVYGLLSGILVLVYLGGVVLLQQVLAPVTADSDAAIAASTLAVAALFRPLRERVQTFIDRRFYRSKYDAADTLAEFTTRLRDQVDLDALARELVEAVGSTFQPAHASVWLRGDYQSRAGSGL